MNVELADAWDLGERHPSTVHPRLCYPHADCNPFPDGAEAQAWRAGCRHEESYLTDFGQFDPSGHLANPYRYPPAPLVSEPLQVAIRAMHENGIGIKRIARELGVRPTHVRKVVRGESIMPYMWV